MRFAAVRSKMNIIRGVGRAMMCRRAPLKISVAPLIALEMKNQVAKPTAT